MSMIRHALCSVLEHCDLILGDEKSKDGKVKSFIQSQSTIKF